MQSHAPEVYRKDRANGLQGYPTHVSIEKLGISHDTQSGLLLLGGDRCVATGSQPLPFWTLFSCRRDLRTVQRKAHSRLQSY